MEYGIQLYSVKDFMAKDVESTIKAVAEMGYSFVEPAGFFEKTAEEFKAICDKYGVTVKSTHSYYSLLQNDGHKKILPYHNTLECPTYIAPAGVYSNKAEVDFLVNVINEYAPIVKDYGMEFMYHNHHKEFLPNVDGIIPHLELQRRTDIRFQIDVYWVYRAGLNPIYILEQLGDRVGGVHLKDGTMEHGTPLGKGNVDIPTIVKWATEHNIPMVVENEPTPERQMIEAKECIDYLKTL